MNLYLVTPPQTRSDETALAVAFLEQGLHRLHVRKPGYTLVDFRQYVDAIPHRFHDRLVLHGAAELLRSYPSVGLHLRGEERQDNIFVQEVLALRPASLSGSLHAWEEMMVDTIPYDYVFISPVFDSISKPGYKAGIDPTGLGALRQWAAERQKRLPRIVALGGVDVSTLPLLRAYGFDGAALLGAVWEAGDPMAAYDMLKRET